MATVLGIQSLEETKLWRRLEAPFTSKSDSEDARRLAPNLLQICGEACDRAKGFSALHPQYTLHDEVHFLRVTELMGLLIPDQVLQDVLSPVEIALLILSAYFHDQGMVLDATELASLESDQRFRLFSSNWTVEHPNYREISQRAIDSRLSEAECKRCHELESELRGSLLTDYVRITHGQRSAEFVRQRYGPDKRLEVASTNIAGHLARLCMSHTLPVDELMHQLQLAHDESIGRSTANMIYLALLLRLADLLDFDRERTPDELFRTIHFTSNVSLAEWFKHRSIEGWIISPGRIRFTASCEHPAYHRAILRFMDYIDVELTGAHSALRLFPAAASKYALPLPEKVDRSRIVPKDDAYIYHDLEFSLSRDEIVKLLMTENLYSSPSLCVRELLQNALDALRHRRSLLKRDLHVEWADGKVILEHTVDEAGREVLRCTDNGIGMDEETVTRFLVRAGRSYYRSPEFELERISLAAAQADFDPCARFGIGFMSCFMLGDQIKILTRRHYGIQRDVGSPLEVAIHGLSGLVIIKKGKSSQAVGTTVEVTGRVKPAFLDEWTDKVNLIQVIDGYALATEFPIEATCRISEIADGITVPITIKKPVTFLEKERVTQLRTYEQDFSEVDSRLRGTVRASLLVDPQGRLVQGNKSAEWVQTEKDGPQIVIHGSKEHHLKLRGEGATCLDGIFVCGEPGRVRRPDRLGCGGNCIGLGHDDFVIDVRGAIKPNLDPARHPRGRSSMDADGTWSNLQKLADQGHGLLWEKILSDLGPSAAPEMFWRYLVFHGAHPAKMTAITIWNKLVFPTRAPDGSEHWKHLDALRAVWFDNDISKGFHLVDSGIISGSQALMLGVNEALLSLKDHNHHEIFPHMLRAALIPMGNLCVNANRLVLEFRSPEEPVMRPWNRIWRQRFGGWTFCVPYAGSLQTALTALGSQETLNWLHPVTKAALDCEFVEEKTDFQRFISSLARCLSDDSTLKLLMDKKYKLHPEDRWRKYIGTAFLAFDWKQIPSPLRPPYTIWLPTQGLVDFGEVDFRRWASA